jgi:hypothetical protein
MTWVSADSSMLGALIGSRLRCVSHSSNRPFNIPARFYDGDRFRLERNGDRVHENASIKGQRPPRG